MPTKRKRKAPGMLNISQRKERPPQGVANPGDLTSEVHLEGMPSFPDVCRVPWTAYERVHGAFDSGVARWMVENLDQGFRTGSSVFMEDYRRITGKSIMMGIPKDSRRDLLPKDYDVVFDIADIPDRVLRGETIKQINQRAGWESYGAAWNPESDWRCLASGKYTAQVVVSRSREPVEGKVPAIMSNPLLSLLNQKRKATQRITLNLLLGDAPEVQAFRLATDAVKTHIEQNKEHHEMVQTQLLCRDWRHGFFEGIRNFVFVSLRDI